MQCHLFFVTNVYKHLHEFVDFEKMSKFLKFNKFIQRDSTSMILKTNIIDGKHSPSFTLTKKLINKLNKD